MQTASNQFHYYWLLENKTVHLKIVKLDNYELFSMLNLTITIWLTSLWMVDKSVRWHFQSFVLSNTQMTHTVHRYQNDEHPAHYKFNIHSPHPFTFTVCTIHKFAVIIDFVWKKNSKFILIIQILIKQWIFTRFINSRQIAQDLIDFVTHHKCRYTHVYQTE